MTTTGDRQLTHSRRAARLPIAAMLFLLTPALANERPPECPQVEQGLDGGAGFEPEYFRIDTRVGDRDAPQRAQDTARARLIERLSPRFSGYDLADLTSHTGADSRVIQMPGLLSPGTACGRAWVETEFLSRIRRQERELTDQLTALAEAIGKRAGKTPVHLRAQTIAECPIPSLGGTLVQRLTGMSGVWTRESGAGVAQVVLSLDASDAKGASATAWYYAPKSVQSTSIGHLSFNPGVLVADVEEAMEEANKPCATNRSLGLSELGTRAGRGGLEVALLDSAFPEVICDGATLDLPIAVNGKANVQIYSVDDRGTAYLIRDSGMVGGHFVESDAPWTKKAQFSAYPDGRPEQLVVVAEPAGGKGTRALGWRGECKVATPFDANLFTNNAALYVQRFQVAPSGKAGCPSVRADPLPSTVAQCGTGTQVPYP